MRQLKRMSLNQNESLRRMTSWQFWPEYSSIAPLIHNDKRWWPEAPLIHNDRAWWPEALLIHNDRACTWPEAPLIHNDRAWWPEALLIHNDRAWWPEAPLIHDDIRWWPEANSYIMIEHGGLRPHSYIIMGRWAHVGGFIMGSQWPTRESAQSHHLNSNFLLLRRVDGSKQIRKLSLLLSCLFV